MTQKKAKLKWHCHRGMRELDLLLEGSLTDQYETLSVADRTSFGRLLDYPNEDLTAWFIDGGSPEDEQLAGIVNRVRDQFCW